MNTSTNVETARRLRDRAKVQRKRGEALRDAGREPEAIKAFEHGRDLLIEAGQFLGSADSEQAATDMAETLGAKGGMLRRLGDQYHNDALQAYKEGAEIERKHGLSSTYNRLNEIKFRLLTGSETLDALAPRIEALARFIEDKLKTDTKLSDTGWPWADLGDCRALLGDLNGARTAYTAYIDKADIQSPETTLDVLNELLEALGKHGDPGAVNLQHAVETLHTQLKGAGAI